MREDEKADSSEDGEGGQSASAQIIQQRLVKARDRLIDRNLRNRLISTPLESTRAKAIRVFEGSSDRVFESIFALKRSMCFLPIPESDASQLPGGKSLYDTDQDSSFSYVFDLPLDEDPRRSRLLQTRLTKESLSKRLLSIYYESREHEEETGANILFLACGFLRWFEDDNSVLPRYAPLVLLPVDLKRQQKKGGGFELQARDDDLMTNISLSVWLSEQFGIALPEIPDEGELRPETYFDLVAAVVEKKERWDVLKDEIMLGFFSFSKFMMWRDLAAESWPSGFGLNDHPIIQELLCSVREHSDPNPPLIPPEDRIDDHFKPRDLTYVLDADSSQTEAIQTALTGRSMVIQGPPGTGKSQSITNLIAAAVHRGQSVLFVAEKMAALEVVHRRLEKVGLSDITLELHSRKGNKRAFHEQLKVALDYPAQSKPSMRDVDRLDELQGFLNDHSDKLNNVLEPWGFTPYELLGALSKFSRLGIRPLNEDVPAAGAYSKTQLEILVNEVKDLVARLTAMKYPEETGYEVCNHDLLLPNEVDYLGDLLEKVIASDREICDAGHQLLGELIGETRVQSLIENGYSLTTMLIEALWWIGVLENWEEEGLEYPPQELVANAFFIDNYLELCKFDDARACIWVYKEYKENSVNPVWESLDIENLLYRLELLGSSFFSIFSFSYWSVRREAEALFSKGIGPKTFANLCNELRFLLKVKQARETVKRMGPSFKDAIGPFWKGEDTETSTLRHFLCHFNEQECFLRLITSDLFRNQYGKFCNLITLSDLRHRFLQLLQKFKTVEIGYQEVRRILKIPDEFSCNGQPNIRSRDSSDSRASKASDAAREVIYYKFGGKNADRSWYRGSADENYSSHSTPRVSTELFDLEYALAMNQVLLLKEHQALVNCWPPARRKISEITTLLGDSLLAQITEKSVDLSSLCGMVAANVSEAVWKEYVKVRPELAEVDAHRLRASLREFRELDAGRKSTATDEVRASYAASRPGGDAGAMGLIRQELMKKRNHLPIRKLMTRAGAAVQKLKPVFLMSPLSVAQYLEPGRLLFDMVVIDEASQVKPEDALGSIARGNQAIVVGDSQQLPPTNFFSRVVDEEGDEDLPDDEYSVGDMESILSLADLALPTRSMLKWHYRSQHPGLIAVSNRNFYDGQLMLPPAAVIGSYSKGLGVSLEKTPENTYQRGGSRGGVNAVEADLVAKAVISFAREYPNKSLGVAAFSVSQRDAIRDSLEVQLKRHPEVASFFSDVANEAFFVKNLESIQGDERDVIFISIGYGRTSEGRMYQSFGPLSAAGGERRLNVLISRAKERVTVFSSITAQDILAQPGSKGISAFREFLQYAEKGYFDLPTETGKDFDSDFEESVAIFLTSHGYKVQPQVGMAGFFIDLGVLDPTDQSRFLCGIECDGASYHSSRSARDRDRLRQDILEARGWSILRIWSTDWFYRRVEQENRLLDDLRSLSKGEKLEQAKPDKEAVSNDRFDLEGEIFTKATAPAVLSPNESSTEPAIYQEYLESHQSPKEIPEISYSQLSPIVLAIVGVEGPVHEYEIARRLASSFGYSKAGSRIQGRVKDVLSNSGLQVDEGFWSKQGQAPRVRNRAHVTSASLKRADMIPPAEIFEAAKVIVKDSVQISKSELIVEISRQFGFDRCGPELKKEINRALDQKGNVALLIDGNDIVSMR